MLDLRDYKLTFADEFNARSISQTGAETTWASIRSQWRFDANSDIGFGHSSFVDPASGYDPFEVAGGSLSITAVPDRTASGYPGSWESGLITTQGGFSQTYGYFEMRADLSDALGAWDAFWLLPVQAAANPGQLPGWQELDVVEHYGSNDRGVYSTIHTTDQTPTIRWQDNRQVYSEIPQPGGYHTYGMDWQADVIGFYVDGRFVGSQKTPSDMHGPMYLLANLATQGSSSNDADAAGVPITTTIDYIRAYSKAPDAVAIARDAVSAPDGHDPGLYGAAVAAPPAEPVADATIARLYYGILDRAPDAAGLRGWADALDAGMSLHDVADAFLGSAEYEVATTGLTDARFLDGMYGQILGRSGDADGLAAWNGYLDRGGARGTVADGFADSLEFQGRYAGGASATYVEGLYEHVLGRHGDAAGLEAWSAALDAHASSRTDVAHGFTGSAEFQARYVGPSAADFVEDLYENALGRHSDPGGLKAYTDALTQGMSRADVAIAISQSPEAQQHLVSESQQGWHLT